MTSLLQSALRQPRRSTATCRAPCARSSTATARRCCDWWRRRRSTPSLRPCAASPTRCTSPSPATTTRSCGIRRRSLAERRAQLELAQAAQPPERFAPFTATEWTSLDYEGATACLRWPAPRAADPPVPPDAVYPDVPMLVLNGDLDNITASSGARVVASRFPRSTFVETANTIHISALSDRDGCAAPMVRRFIATLDAGDTSCAARIAEVRTVGAFPRRRRRAAARPSGRSAGRRGGSRDRRRRDHALADQLQRREPRAARRPLELHGLEGREVPLPGRALRPRRAGQRHGDLADRDGRGPRLVRVPGGRVRAAWNVRQQLARATLNGGSVGGRWWRTCSLRSAALGGAVAVWRGRLRRNGLAG